MALNLQEAQQLYLQLGEISQYPYLNHTFEAQVFLVDDRGQLKANVDVAIKVSLFFDEKQMIPCNPKLMVVEDDGNGKILKNGTTTLRIKLTELSMNHDNKKFVIVFNGTTPYYVVHKAITHPILCVQHRLIIKDMKENPFIWYKDEGGKEKSIEMTITLVDRNNAKVLNRRVHLKLILQYENGQECPRQEILRPNNESRLFIDESTGDAVFRFRIDEVSRSHQKQLFRVVVSPDAVHYPLTSDISPDVSVPIEVRSKRNKKDSLAPEKRSRIDNSDAYSRISSSLPTVGNVIFNSEHGIPKPSGSHTASSKSSMPSLDTAADGHSGYNAVSAPPSMELPGLIVSNGTGYAAQDSPSDTQENSDSAQISLWKISKWVNLVLNVVASIQWKCIGYQRLPNGENDLSKPLYDIPNPTEALSLLIEEYNRTAVHSLEALQDELIRHGLGPTAHSEQAHDDDESVSRTQSHLDGPGAPSMLLQGTGPPRLSSTTSASSASSASGQSQSSIHVKDLLSLVNHQSLSIPWRTTNIENTAFLSNRAGMLDLDIHSDPALLPPSSTQPAPHFKPWTAPSTTPSSTPALSRYSTLDFLDIIDSASVQENLESMGTLSQQKLVYYILARPYFSSTGTEVGLPAFDANKSLLGFFRDGSTAVDTAVSVRLHLLADCPELNKKDVEKLTNQLEQEALDDAENNAVLSLPLFYFNLAEMIDAAFVRSWNVPVEGFT